MNFGDLIKYTQQIWPWVVGLSAIPKVIISIVITLIAAFLLVLLWAPLPEDAVKDILAKCYRRALFTRTHAQLSQEAMFDSIDDCRKAVQADIPKIKSAKLTDLANQLFSSLDGILRKPD